MSALLWWLIPVTVTALAVLVVAVIRRPRKPLADGTGDYAQLREAMTKPLPHEARSGVSKSHDSRRRKYT